MCPCALPADLNEIPDRTDLETLRVHFSGGADPRRLERLTHLRALEVAFPTSAQLRAVATLSRVEVLKVTAWESPDLATLATMRQLRSLTLEDAFAKEIDLAPLAGLPQLREIRIEGEPVSLAGVAALRSVVLVRDESRRASPERSVAAGGGICDIDPSACPSGVALRRSAEWACLAEVYAIPQ
jgi:hypothetical protein